ncbi:hypothetical protein [Flavobacterium limnosediminis]|nr:hypothetical protein [Flavobacterium limnosediminis]
MKPIKLLFTLTCLSFCFITKTQAQIGIGTTNPTAKFEIDASTDAIPALEIVPRATAPTGTANGQIAMIDNSLYIYDLTRAKWLSSETIILNYSATGNTENEYLNINDNDSGIRLPFDATLIAITARATGGGDTSRTVRIRKNSSNTDLLTFVAANYLYSSTTTNLNFNAGDYINIYIADEPNDFDNPNVTLFLKWRE